MNAPIVYAVGAIFAACLIGSGKMGLFEAVLAGIILIILTFVINPFGKRLETAIDKQLYGPSKIIVAAIVAIVILGAAIFGKAYLFPTALPVATPEQSKEDPKAPPLAPIQKPSEPVPPFHEKVGPTPSVKTVPHKTSPPIVKKDVPIKPKEIIPDKPDKPIETAQTAPIEATPIQPKEKLVDVLIRKYPVTRETHPELARSPTKSFIQDWLKVIKKVNDDQMLTHDLEMVMKARTRWRLDIPISDGALASEALFTLHCLESEGYVRLTETRFRVQAAPDRIINNVEFEFLPERLIEFNAGL